MKRREFALSAAALALPLGASAQVRVPEEGREYRRLDKAVPVEVPAGRIEVVEFFWYSCPHCNAFEPALVAWSRNLPPDVSLRRVPAAFRDDMVPQQRLFYALEAMGKGQELHQKVFDAIHSEKVNLTLLGPMVAWLGRQGVDTGKFTELYNSFAISAKARRATDLQDMYTVEGVPALGVGGIWYTDTTLASGHARALQVVDYLVAQVRKTR